EKVAKNLSGGEKDDFARPENRPSIISKHVGVDISEAEVERYGSLRKEREELLTRAPGKWETALAVREQGPHARDTFILNRGMPANKGERVEPGFPSVFSSAPPSLPTMTEGTKTCWRRRVLAEWIADAKNPLTARVMANRLFQFNFGRGIVRSSSNFGYQGSPPTHPELLDWLASELIVNGWRLKSIQRLLLTSNAFRMSSRPDTQASTIDPENDLSS